MKKFTLCLLLAPLLFVTACVNNDDGTSSKLPAETVTGKNTFGCKIGDQTFLPRDRGGLNIEDPTPILQARYIHDGYASPGYSLFIMAENELLERTIIIRMEGLSEPLQEGGVYPIIEQAPGNINAFFMDFGKYVDQGNGNGFQPIYEYYTTDEHYGTLTVTKLDTANKIISGTFSFDCLDSETGTVAKITAGRFDITYKEYE